MICGTSPETVEKNAQHLTMKGKIGAGGGGAPAAAAGGGGGGLSPDDVAKHNKKEPPGNGVTPSGPRR